MAAFRPSPNSPVAPDQPRRGGSLVPVLVLVLGWVACGVVLRHAWSERLAQASFGPTTWSSLAWAGLLSMLGVTVLAGLLWRERKSGRRAFILARELTRDMERTRHELQTALRLQRSVLDGTVYGIVATGIDGLVTEFNAGAEEMLGYTRDEVVGRLTPLQFHDPVELAERSAVLTAELGRPVAAGLATLAAAAETPTSREREWTYIRKNGSRLPILLSITVQRGPSGELLGYLGVAVDISARKKVELAYRASEDRLSRVLGHADCLVWEAKVELRADEWTWRVSVIPSALCARLVGQRDVEGTRNLWDDFDIPEHAEMRARTREALDQGASGYAHEFRLTQESETLWLRESVAITRIGPNLFWLTGVAIDITERKRTESALRQSRRRLDDVFRSMGEGLVLERADGVVIECNEAACRILGVSRDQLMGQDPLVPKWTMVDDSGGVIPWAQRPSRWTLDTGESQRDRVLSIRRPEGKEAWLSINVEALRAEGEALRTVVVSFTDITRRKLAEESMGRSQELLRNVTNMLPGTVSYWTADLRCAFGNDEYQAWYGRSTEQLAVVRPEELLGPELYRRVEDKIRGVLAGTRQRFERELRSPNGDVRHTWVQYIPDFAADGKTVRGFVAVATDVTEMKRQQEALRASEARLRRSLQDVTSLKTALDAHANVAITDADGVITYANERFCQVSKYSREELVGQAHRITNSGRHSRAFFAEMWATISAGRIWHGEICNRAKDGEFFWVDATIVPFLDESGRPVQYIAVRTDITERKHLEERLAVARDQALESSRLKSEFLATMSHEIRTPMNAIIGMAGLMADTPLNADQADMLRIVTGAAESLLTIINDILDFSRIESGQMRLDLAEFDLGRVVEESVALLAPKAHAKHIELNCELHPAPACLLYGDAGRIRQILLNLIGNAIKFTDVGEVSLTAAVLAETPERIRVRLSVRDTGIGIAPEAKDRLFHPFVQVDGSATRRFGGTGLGLAITRQLVAAMEGVVDFESQPGRGSTFWVELEFPRRGALHAEPPPARLAGQRVLVVDDNATNRAILLRQLSHFGIQAEAVANAASALVSLRSQPRPPFSLAILDWLLPGVSGLELAQAIRADPALAALPLVVLSSAAAAGESRAAQEIGFAAVLTKPASESKLIRCLGRVLAAESAGLSARAVIAPPVKSGHLLVLLVEDNHANQRVASLLLSRMGHHVELAGNGHQALEKLANRHYDVVLMDCQMPYLDGYETTRSIRAGTLPGIDQNVPIIALTAYARPEDQARCFEVGMNGYLSKPVRADELKRALDQVIQSRETALATGAVIAETVLDLQVVEMTRSLPGEKGGSLLPELVHLYLQDEPARLQRLAGLAAERARGELADEVHGFGGNAASFGGIEVRRVALEVEEAARAENWTDVDARMHELEKACRRLRERVRDLGLIS